MSRPATQGRHRHHERAPSLSLLSCEKRSHTLQYIVFTFFTFFWYMGLIPLLHSAMWHLERALLKKNTKHKLFFPLEEIVLGVLFPSSATCSSSIQCPNKLHRPHVHLSGYTPWSLFYSLTLIRAPKSMPKSAPCIVPLHTKIFKTRPSQLPSLNLLALDSPLAGIPDHVPYTPYPLIPSIRAPSKMINIDL